MAIAVSLGLAPNDHRSRTAANPTVAVQRVSVVSAPLSDQAVMVLVGTALIGLGALVRRAN